MLQHFEIDYNLLIRFLSVILLPNGQLEVVLEGTASLLSVNHFLLPIFDPKVTGRLVTRLDLQARSSI